MNNEIIKTILNRLDAMSFEEWKADFGSEGYYKFLTFVKKISEFELDVELKTKINKLNEYEDIDKYLEQNKHILDNMNHRRNISTSTVLAILFIVLIGIGALVYFLFLK